MANQRKKFALGKTTRRIITRIVIAAIKIDKKKLARVTTKIPTPISEFWAIKWTCAPFLECSACYSNTYRVAYNIEKKITSIFLGMLN